MSGVNISICDGKYTVIQAPTGTTRVLRYGEEWRDVTGDNVIGGLAWELQEARDRIKRLEEAVEAYRTAYTPDGHVAPHDCFATGPKTGNPIEDLVACPGCWAERKAKEAKL